MASTTRSTFSPLNKKASSTKKSMPQSPIFSAYQAQIATLKQESWEKDASLKAKELSISKLVARLSGAESRISELDNTLQLQLEATEIRQSIIEDKEKVVADLQLDSREQGRQITTLRLQVDELKQNLGAKRKANAKIYEKLASQPAANASEQDLATRRYREEIAEYHKVVKEHSAYTLRLIKEHNEEKTVLLEKHKKQHEELLEQHKQEKDKILEKHQQDLADKAEKWETQLEAVKKQSESYKAETLAKVFDIGQLRSTHRREIDKLKDEIIRLERLTEEMSATKASQYKRQEKEVSRTKELQSQVTTLQENVRVLEKALDSTAKSKIGQDQEIKPLQVQLSNVGGEECEKEKDNEEPIQEEQNHKISSNRKGDKAFTRKDHLTEREWNNHKQDVLKKPKGRTDYTEETDEEDAPGFGPKQYLTNSFGHSDGITSNWSWGCFENLIKRNNTDEDGSNFAINGDEGDDFYDLRLLEDFGDELDDSRIK